MYVIGCLHDGANIEQTSSWLKQAYRLKCRPGLRLLAHSWSGVT